MTLSGLAARVFTPANISMFGDWRRQPTTVAGLSALGGTLTALASGQVSWSQALVGFVMAGIGMVLPDNANRKISSVPAAVAATPAAPAR